MNLLAAALLVLACLLRSKPFAAPFLGRSKLLCCYCTRFRLCGHGSCLQLSWHVWPFLILGFNWSWVRRPAIFVLSTTLARLLTASSGCCLAQKITILLPVKQTFCLRSKRWTAPFKTNGYLCILHVPLNVGCRPVRHFICI
jgi:hypothetical protein